MKSTSVAVLFLAVSSVFGSGTAQARSLIERLDHLIWGQSRQLDSAFTDYDSGKYEEAFKLFSAYASGRSSQVANYNAGVAAFKAGKHDEAAKFWERAATGKDLDPSLKARALHNRALVQIEKKELEGARDALKEALAFDNDNKPVFENLKWVEEQLKNKGQDQKPEDQPQNDQNQADKDKEKKDQESKDQQKQADNKNGEKDDSQKNEQDSKSGEKKDEKQEKNGQDQKSAENKDEKKGQGQSKDESGKKDDLKEKEKEKENSTSSQAQQDKEKKDQKQAGDQGKAGDEQKPEDKKAQAAADKENEQSRDKGQDEKSMTEQKAAQEAQAKADGQAILTPAELKSQEAERLLRTIDDKIGRYPLTDTEATGKRGTDGKNW